MTPRLSVSIALTSRRSAQPSLPRRSHLSRSGIAGLAILSLATMVSMASAQQNTSNATMIANAASTNNVATTNASNSDSSGFDFSGNKPIDISADNGIEWRKQDKVYIARGKAIAVQGDQSIAADTLTGYYSTDSNHIDRMTAEGNVVIKNSTQTAYGEHADYDTSTKLLVMTGKNLKSVTDKGDIVTARDRMEYWKDRDTVVAKGDVHSTHGDTKTHSDTLNGYFHVNSAGKKVLYQVEAIGNVRTDTAKQTAWSDKMVNNLETKIAVLTGHVRIVQGNNTFTGDRAEINTATNVSRLLADPSKGGGRVHTIIGPKNKSPVGGSSTTKTSNNGASGAADGTGVAPQP